MRIAELYHQFEFENFLKKRLVFWPKISHFGQKKVISHAGAQNSFERLVLHNYLTIWSSADVSCRFCLRARENFGGLLCKSKCLGEIWTYTIIHQLFEKQKI